MKGRPIPCPPSGVLQFCPGPGVHVCPRAISTCPKNAAAGLGSSSPQPGSAQPVLSLRVSSSPGKGWVCPSALIPVGWQDRAWLPGPALGGLGETPTLPAAKESPAHTVPGHSPHKYLLFISFDLCFLYILSMKSFLNYYQYVKICMYTEYGHWS